LWSVRISTSRCELPARQHHPRAYVDHKHHHQEDEPRRQGGNADELRRRDLQQAESDILG
jgi:hypothetical protein